MYHAHYFMHTHLNDIWIQYLHFKVHSKSSIIIQIIKSQWTICKTIDVDTQRHVWDSMRQIGIEREGERERRRKREWARYRPDGREETHRQKNKRLYTYLFFLFSNYVYIFDFFFVENYSVYGMVYEDKNMPLQINERY